MIRKRDVAYLGLVDLTSEGERDGHGNALLEKAANLAGAVNLGAERRGTEVVLGTNGSGTVTSRATHHKSSGRGLELEVHVNTSLNTLGQLAPVSGVESALGLQLSGTNPVFTLVLGGVGQSSLGASGDTLALPDSLETKSETGGDGLQVAADEDTGETTLEARGVEGLEGRGEVTASVVVIDLDQALSTTVHDLSIGLGDKGLVPAVVGNGGERTVTSVVTLHKHLSENDMLDTENRRDRHTDRMG